MPGLCLAMEAFRAPTMPLIATPYAPPFSARTARASPPNPPRRAVTSAATSSPTTATGSWCGRALADPGHREGRDRGREGGLNGYFSHDFLGNYVGVSMPRGGSKPDEGRAKAGPLHGALLRLRQGARAI